MFKPYCLILFTLLTLIKGNAQEALGTLEGKKILVVYGGWEGHQPKFFGKKIASWLVEQKAKVQLVEGTKVYANTSMMKDLDLIIQHITMSKMTQEESRGLTSAVSSGVGLMGCHGGLVDSFRNNTEYQYMVGGQFVDHPGGQVTYTVKIKSKTDSITSGINNFSLHSEQYYMHLDPTIEILATTEFSGIHNPLIQGVVMPVVWKKKFGKGRVFFNAIGHSKKDFEIPEVWTLITRGIRWAAKKD